MTCPGVCLTCLEPTDCGICCFECNNAISAGYESKYDLPDSMMFEDPEEYERIY